MPLSRGRAQPRDDDATVFWHGKEQMGHGWSRPHAIRGSAHAFP